MKFIEKLRTNQHGNKIVYDFAIGRQEAQILLGLINKALMYGPQLKLTQSVESRLRNMGKTIYRAIPRMPKGKDNEEFETI